jgi:hypothetical protein
MQQVHGAGEHVGQCWQHHIVVNYGWFIDINIVELAQRGQNWCRRIGYVHMVQDEDIDMSRWRMSKREWTEVPLQKHLFSTSIDPNTDLPLLLCIVLSSPGNYVIRVYLFCRKLSAAYIYLICKWKKHYPQDLKHPLKSCLWRNWGL